MKKLILLLFVVFAVFVLINRQRIFLRDPLGSVTRNGIKEEGAQVYVNYSNDVLLQNETSPAYMMVVQSGDHVGSPLNLKCVHWMACMTNAYPATVLPQPASVHVVEMASKQVRFQDAEGHEVSVKLR